jgi:putative (di)nucleoside polyphosphate hydrolase
MAEPVDLSLYRPCVGILLLNDAGQVWVGRRNDMEEESWQMPQGGIDAGETPREAALRELAEESGTDNVEVIGESQNWLHYDLPQSLQGKLWKGKFRGQRQLWFAMRFRGEDQSIRPTEVENPEFNAWRWVDINSLPDLIVAFKRDIYQAVVDEFRTLANSAKVG